MNYFLVLIPSEFLSWLVLTVLPVVLLELEGLASLLLLQASTSSERVLLMLLLSLSHTSDPGELEPNTD